jgi:hypothetical protein
VLRTMAGLMKHVCVCARAHTRVLFWRWLGKRHMSYSIVLYHISRNFLTAPRMLSVGLNMIQAIQTKQL